MAVRDKVEIVKTGIKRKQAVPDPTGTGHQFHSSFHIATDEECVDRNFVAVMIG